MSGFDDLGGIVTDAENAHVTLTFFFADGGERANAELVINGGDGNFASVKLDADEVRRLRNLLGRAERRFR